MLKFGFFDSVRGDRKYNSRDVAELFDGLIVDGIYAQLYERFSVNVKKVIETEEDKMTVTVGTGQAWLSHTKILNTSKMEFILPQSIGADRYDALIIEVNDNTRQVSIFVKPNVKTQTEYPFDLQPGQLTNTEFIHQYLLAVIFVESGETRVRQENIGSKIGFDIPDGIPYVTCPLEPFPADETLKQWVAQWYAFLNGSDAAFKTAQQDRAVQFDNSQNNREEAFTADQNARITDYQALRQSIVDWMNSTETDWNTWYASVKDDLEGYFSGKIEEHNQSIDAHPYIQECVNTLISRLNALADSDDTTLDQMSEVVSFIKQNRETIQVLTDVTNEGIVANTKDKAGYVTAGGTNANTFWGTDSNGNPAWRLPENIYRHVASSFSEIDISNAGLSFWEVVRNGSDPDEPPVTVTDYPRWWNVLVFGSGNRKVMIASNAFQNRDKLYFKVRHDDTWYGWYTLGGITPIEKGGTGKTTAKDSINALCTGIPHSYNTASIDDSYIIPMTTAQNISMAWRTMGTVYNYIMSKIGNASEVTLYGGDLTLTKSGSVIRGSNESGDNYYNHAIRLGHSGQNEVNFYEYGGVYNFYRRMGTVETLLGRITSSGWEGKVYGKDVSTLPDKSYVDDLYESAYYNDLYCHKRIGGSVSNLDSVSIDTKFGNLAWAYTVLLIVTVYSFNTSGCNGSMGFIIAPHNPDYEGSSNIKRVKLYETTDLSSYITVSFSINNIVLTSKMNNHYTEYSFYLLN